MVWVAAEGKGTVFGDLPIDGQNPAPVGNQKGRNAMLSSIPTTLDFVIQPNGEGAGLTTTLVDANPVQENRALGAPENQGEAAGHQAR